MLVLVIGVMHGKMNFLLLFLIDLSLRRSRVIGDSFSEFRHIESRKSKVCIALLAHDKGVCAVGELSVLCIIHVYVLVHLWPCRCASRKAKSRVIGDSF